jgi:hypothetical protein
MEEITLQKNYNVALQKQKSVTKFRKYFNLIGFEALIWISGLIYLAIFSPLDQTHFTICPLANAGFDYCPGCGLGHSITQLFHGNFIQSFNTHPLGFFALIIILHRIFTLIKKNIIHYKKAKA